MLCLSLPLLGASRQPEKSGLMQMEWQPRGRLTQPEVKAHLFIPQAVKPDEKFPLLVLMHGSGETGEGSIKPWRAAAERHRFMILAPTRDGVFKPGRESLQPFFEMIRWTAGHYPVAEKRVFCAGISSGSVFCQWLMTLEPGLFQGVALIAGDPFAYWQERADIASLPRIFYVHGLKDRQFPYRLLRTRIQVLESRGAHVQWHLDPNAGHELRPEWPDLALKWFLSETGRPAMCRRLPEAPAVIPGSGSCSNRPS